MVYDGAIFSYLLYTLAPEQGLLGIVALKYYEASIQRAPGMIK